MKRTVFYIDGFNFYYGLRRMRKSSQSSQWGNYYWIDMVKLCESFLGQEQKLEKVIYFTSSPLDAGKNSRQSAFLNANKLLNGSKFEIVRGKYLEKHVICPYCKGNITKPEEKRTDVNISIRMLADCVDDLVDVIALVSADSDLVPPLELIQRHYPEKRIKVYFPPSNFSHDLKGAISRLNSRPILMMKNERRFKNAIMDDEVQDGKSRFIIPEKWKNWQLSSLIFDK